MFSPQSLFDQCILFIAYNVDKVEDFVGFPSQIGEKIFSTAIMQPRFFDDHEYADQTLNVFSEAFGEELMYSLNMAGEHLCLNYHLEAILKFQDLHCLDLSHCGLGDNHELLQHIAHFYSLEQLCLKGNSITDAGIQKLTIPFRMFKHGPSRLSVVDLSGNTGVSVLCLKYFTQFPRLTRVVLSNGPSSKVPVPVSPWKCSEEVRPVTMVIGTEGWAQPVIKTWKENNAQRLKNPKPKKSSGFYRRKVDELMHCGSRKSSNEAMEGFIVAVKDDGVTTSTIVIPYAQNHDKKKQVQDIIKASEDHVSSIMTIYAACHDVKVSHGHGLLDSLDTLRSTATVSMDQRSVQHRRSCSSPIGQYTHVLYLENCENMLSSRKGILPCNKSTKGGRVCKRLKPLLNISAEVKGRTVDGKQHSSLMKTGNHCQLKYAPLPADAKSTNMSCQQSNKAALSNIGTTSMQFSKYTKNDCQEFLPLKPTFIPNFLKSSTSTGSVNIDSMCNDQPADSDPSCNPQKHFSNISQCNVEVKEKQLCKDRKQFVLLGNSDTITNKSHFVLKFGEAQHGFKTKKINMISRKRTFENYFERDSCVTNEKNPVLQDTDNKECGNKSVKKLKTSILDALDAY
ncbi:uncharacterized protein LOC127842073 isoform X1 [Dreissena polymorpha]|uniref:Leucine-rich repeat-containing protein 42 n=1 Tax=Dreissena polymorpha TaxID=45954 RepID=A0A9D4EFJ4_DREPO|nr:uncharacterized protein LOC127842073 isoform X1 [Dreissena polymorpha]KAH3779427.1 hypothetical protein DPMN_157230 [Dreissena polymorpha]